MKEIFNQLKTARHAINWSRQHQMPQYEALAQLERALSLLAEKVLDIDNRLDGIIPD